MRLKIISGDLMAVLVLGVLSYALTRRDVEGELEGRLHASAPRNAALFERSFRLSSLDFLAQIDDRAGQRIVRSALASVGEEARRQRAFQAAETIAQWFRDPARGHPDAPEMVVLTDETGRVLARDKDINRMFGRSLVGPLPILREVLASGVSRHAVFFDESEKKLLLAGASPIVQPEGGVIGALVVGYELSNGVARAEVANVGGELAIFVDGRLDSSSLPGSPAAALERAYAGLASSGGGRSLDDHAPFPIEVGAKEYVVSFGTLPGSMSNRVAYALLLDQTAELASARGTSLVLLLTLCAALGVILYGFLIANGFLRPLERIEEEILAIINGRRDRRIEVESAELGGLAYRINQLVNVLGGVGDVDSDGRVTGSFRAPNWRGDTFSSPGGEAPGDDLEPIDDDAVAARLAVEPESQYYRRLFETYVAQKAAQGENASHLTEERFRSRARGIALSLAERYGCDAVRFEVQIRGDQVILRPVLIRSSALAET